MPNSKVKVEGVKLEANIAVNGQSPSQISYPEPKKPRTVEDFNLMVNYILDYVAKEDVDGRLMNSSPNSMDSTATASSPSPVLHNDSDRSDFESEDEGYHTVTCYCAKPFAGRPMIECSECNTWIHLSCAKIRKSNVPEVFICQRCKDAKYAIRRSARVKNQSKHRLSDV